MIQIQYQTFNRNHLIWMLMQIWFESKLWEMWGFADQYGCWQIESFYMQITLYEFIWGSEEMSEVKMKKVVYIDGDPAQCSIKLEDFWGSISQESTMKSLIKNKSIEMDIYWFSIKIRARHKKTIIFRYEPIYPHWVTKSLYGNRYCYIHYYNDLVCWYWISIRLGFWNSWHFGHRYKPQKTVYGNVERELWLARKYAVKTDSTHQIFPVIKELILLEYRW